MHNIIRHPFELCIFFMIVIANMLFIAIADLAVKKILIKIIKSCLVAFGSLSG